MPAAGHSAARLRTGAVPAPGTLSRGGPASRQDLHLRLRLLSARANDVQDGPPGTMGRYGRGRVTSPRPARGGSLTSSPWRGRANRPSHQGSGELIAGGQNSSHDVPVAVITNGSLLGRPGRARGTGGSRHRAAVARRPRTTVCSSWSTVGPRRCAWPTSSDGMATFRKGFAGQVWLEVMLLGTASQTCRRGRGATRGAGRAHRPRSRPAQHSRAPTGRGVRGGAGRRQVASGSSPPCSDPHAEVSRRRPAGRRRPHSSNSADVLALLSRRPCSVCRHRHRPGNPPGEALKAVTGSSPKARWQLHTHGDRSFYAAAAAATERLKEEMPSR